MAKLTFQLTRDNNQVQFRELTIGNPATDILFFTTTDLSAFTTDKDTVFSNETPIDILPKTRTIKVVVRADAETGDGWKLTFSISGILVTLPPISEIADNGGRANFEGTRTWPKVNPVTTSLTAGDALVASFFDISSVDELVDDFGTVSSHAQAEILKELGRHKRRRPAKPRKKKSAAPSH